MDIGIPELTDEQIEAVSQAAENAVRKHVFSKISQKLVEDLTVIIEAEGGKPVSFTVEVDLVLMPETKGLSEKELVQEAVKAAFDAIEKELRKLCPSTK